GMCRCVFDLPAVERELGELRAETAAPDLWDEPQRAQALMKRVARLEGTVNTWAALDRGIEDLEAMLELAAEAGEAEQATLVEEMGEELAGLERRFADL